MKFLQRSIIGIAAITTLSLGGVGWGAAIATAASPATVSYPCNKTYYSGTALTVQGDTGNRVIEVQCQLYWRGNLKAGQVDADFGPITRSAVIAFQKSFNKICNGGLAVDGEVGVHTWGALRSPCPCLAQFESAPAARTAPAALACGRARDDE